MKPLTAAAFTAALAACASEPLSAPSTPTVTATSDVIVYADGFVRTGDRRMPIEAFVLATRQRARAMDAEARLGLRVDIVADPDGGEQVTRHVDWLIDQLQIVGIVNAGVR